VSRSSSNTSAGIGGATPDTGGGDLKLKRDWSKWFVLGKKPRVKGKPGSGFVPMVRYQGRKVIILGAIAFALIPAVALAKGPIVRAGESVLAAILKAFGF